MHEMSLLRGLFKQIESVARDNAAERVTVVRLKVGPLAHIEPDHLREHFIDAAHGTVAESARLEIESTDELHELTLESVDVDLSGAASRPATDCAIPPSTRNLPALEALAHERRHSKHVCAPCLATGGHVKAAPAVWTGRHAILTDSIGNMDDPQVRASFAARIRELTKLYQVDPATIACDLHPDYYTTLWACEQAKPIVRVQHHHAHAVACMVEHDLLDREVTAITWDGTGFGPDGTIWGGEVLHASTTGFQRIASLLPFPLPGGESAIRCPNRVAFAMLFQSRTMSELLRDNRLRDRFGLSQIEMSVLASMVERRINTPQTSSVGRLFDAVAALVLGIHKVDFEGQAAIQLEATANPAERDFYELPVGSASRLVQHRVDLRNNGTLASPSDDPSSDCVFRADWRPLLNAIVDDCLAGIEPGVISARFHNSLARWAAAVVDMATPPRDVVLSGGCFQNVLLTDRVADSIRATGRRVFCHHNIPTGDAGLAVGQLAIAMCCN